MHRWQVGDTVLIRNLARSDGTVTTAIPAIAVSDEPDLLALYIPDGTRYKNNWVVSPNMRAVAITSVTPSAQRQYRDLVMRNDSMRLYLPGYGYSVGLSFDAAGEFTGWYGNIEAPFVRTPLGIDTRDLALDVVATPDGQWRWKDEDEFNRRLEIGIDTPEQHAWTRRAGLDFIERLEGNCWPFNSNWPQWKPSSQWTERLLPENWAIDLGTASSWDKSYAAT